MEYLQIGLRIKRLREDTDAKWSVQQVADKLKVSDQSVRNWEAGERLTLNNIEQIAKFYKVSEGYIIFGRSANTKPATQALQAVRGKMSNIAWIQQMCEDIEEKTLGSLINLFSQLSPPFQDRVLTETNFLHAIEYPNATNSNPYGNIYLDVIRKAVERADRGKK